MGICNGCSSEYDHSDKRFTYKVRLLVAVSKCPNCGALNRTDYFWSVITIFSISAIACSLYLLAQASSISVEQNPIKYAVICVGIVSSAIGFKLTKLVIYNET
jgi:hypothetical protein